MPIAALTFKKEPGGQESTVHIAGGIWTMRDKDGQSFHCDAWIGKADNGTLDLDDGKWAATLVECEDMRYTLHQMDDLPFLQKSLKWKRETWVPPRQSFHL